MAILYHKKVIKSSCLLNPLDLKLELEKNRKQIYNDNERGIFDYETDSYVKEKNERSSSEEIRETIGNKDVRTNRRRLKYDSELDNSSFSLKQKQLNIILKNNPVNDDYHTWIRNIEDIKTLEETLQDSDYKENYKSTGTRTNFSGIRQKTQEQIQLKHKKQLNQLLMT